MYLAYHVCRLYTLDNIDLACTWLDLCFGLLANPKQLPLRLVEHELARNSSKLYSASSDDVQRYGEVLNQ